MKKAIPLLIALVILGTIFGASAAYRNHQQAESLRTTAAPRTETTESKELTENDVIVQTDDGKYKLYYKNNTATLTYGDAKLEFYTWGRSIELETPTFHYMDFNDDGENELIIRIIDSYNDVKSTSSKSYSLFFIHPVEKNGKIELSSFSAQPSMWKRTFQAYVKEEISQLKNTKKYIQFVMTNNGNTISYDEKTGIAKNKYVGYAKTDSDDKGQYYTVLSYYKGVGVYSVLDNGKITLDIQLFVTYEEIKDARQIGNIHCEVACDSSHFYVKSDTISFIPLEEYEIDDPRDTVQND